MKRVAIICGHFGPWTGASWEGVDEWDLAQKSALAVYESLLQDQAFHPLLFQIDKSELRWTICRDFLGKRSSLRIKSRWIEEVSPDAVLEFHYNSAADFRACGHEVVYETFSNLVPAMDRGLEILPNRHRDPKRRNLLLQSFLEELDNPPPFVILEPAFIFEKDIHESEWNQFLITAVQYGLKEYFGEGNDDT